MWETLRNNVLEVKLMVHMSKVDDTVEEADRNGFKLVDSYEVEYNRVLLFESKVNKYLRYKPTK